jgi:SAM-dependent methyltransferase
MFDKKTHWERIYREKSSSDVSWFQESPDLSLELIRRSGVRNDEAIVDVGGGASVLVDVLCEEGFRNLSVLDISGIALAGAQQRLGDLAETIEWFESDITEFDPPHAFTLWHDRAVFHFLTDESDRRKYVSVLKRALRPGGLLIIAAFAIGGPEQCSGLQVVQYDSSRLKAELGEEFELVEERDEVHITPANKEQRFTYFRFVRKT